MEENIDVLYAAEYAAQQLLSEAMDTLQMLPKRRFVIMPNAIKTEDQRTTVEIGMDCIMPRIEIADDILYDAWEEFSEMSRSRVFPL